MRSTNTPGLIRFGVICIGLCGLLLPLRSLAQASPRWYQIEIVFFRNLAGKAQFEEQWPQRGHITLPDPSYRLPTSGTSTGPQTFALTSQRSDAFEDWGDLPKPSSEQSASELPSQLQYTGVPVAQRALAGAASRLNQRQDYRVISYHAWRQPLPAEQKPLFFQVSSGNLVGDQATLEGAIGLSLKRYLHVDTELWWSESSGDEAELSPTAHLLENRRMRSGETHYLDHPLIGVLLHITALEKN